MPSASPTITAYVIISVNKIRMREIPLQHTNSDAFSHSPDHAHYPYLAFSHWSSSHCAAPIATTLCVQLISLPFPIPYPHTDCCYCMRSTWILCLLFNFLLALSLSVLACFYCYSKQAVVVVIAAAAAATFWLLFFFIACGLLFFLWASLCFVLFCFIHSVFRGDFAFLLRFCGGTMQTACHLRSTVGMSECVSVPAFVGERFVWKLVQNMAQNRIQVPS